MLTVMIIIAVSAFICTIISALGKCPLWIATVLICLFMLLQVLPKG